MKTKRLKTRYFLLIAVFIIFTVIIISNNIIRNNDKEYRLLLENVEALTSNEPSGNNECMGQPRYEETGIFEGKEEERTHIGNGTDRVTIYNVKRCYAAGSGKINGVDGFEISSSFVSSSETPCNEQCDYYK